MKNPNANYDKLLQNAKRAREPHDREAWLNLAFYLDQQYVEWYVPPGVTKSQPTFRVIPRDDDDDRRPRPVVNKIMHYTRQSHASALQDKPRGDVLPVTDDISDISDAMVAKAWIDEQSEPTVANWDARLSRAALWALIAGTSWLKWVWNPVDKKMDIMPVSFFEGYCDPYATEWDKVRYFIHSQFLDPEQVYDQWGVEAQSDSISKTDNLKASLMQGMGSAPLLEGVTVNELWHKPTRRHPNGLYVVWAGNQQLDVREKLPYDVLRQEKKLPFTMLGCIERPDSMYCMSPIKYLRSAQMELNLYHAQRIIQRQKFTGKWWIPNELDMQMKPDDSPAQILRGQSNGGLEPKIIQPSTWMPNDDGEMIETQMMHIVGQHEVSQAQVPGRVEAAKAIEMLLSQDANALSHLRDTIAIANSQGWYLGLEYAREFADDETLVTAYSREGLPEVKKFKASKLKPGFRVRTTMTTGLANTRAARQDQLLRLWDAKIITDAALISELMDLPLPSIVGGKANDMKGARNENLDLAKGIAIQPGSWDDHTIHLREHNNYRKSADFKLLSDDTKTKFEHHCDRHEQLQEIELGKQARLAAIAQGAQLTQSPGNTTPPPNENTTSSETKDESDNERPTTPPA